VACCGGHCPSIKKPLSFLQGHHIRDDEFDDDDDEPEHQGKFFR
jgi:hypothetical protein